MMISRLGRSGNSPPWYLPEMKRNAHGAASPVGLSPVMSRGLNVLKTWKI